jgi:hypothetical protein
MVLETNLKSWDMQISTNLKILETDLEGQPQIELNASSDPSLSITLDF